jgi:AraC-like DNA-binding protein/two-component sensor histidine kinase
VSAFDLDELRTLLAKTGRNLSKEFGSPLEQIVRPLEELLLKEKEIVYKEELQFVLKNAWRFQSLISLLEEIAEIESGEGIAQLQKSDLIQFCHGITNSFQQAAAKREVQLHFTSNSTQFDCYFDFRKLRRILYTLTANAIRYSNKKDGEVKVSIELSKDKSAVSITVSDNGIGIQADKIPHLTNPFYDDPLHLKYYQSTSLGLYLVKRLLDVLEGKLAFISKTGQGTLAVVEIPIFQTTESIVYDQYQIDQIFENGPFQLNELIKEVDTYEIVAVETLQKTKKPLIIVLAPENAHNLWQHKLSDTYRIIFAQNMEKGIRLIMDHSPDLVVLEQAMNPEFIQALKFLKSNSRSSAIPIVWVAPSVNLEEKISANTLLIDEILLDSESNELHHTVFKKLIRNRELVQKETTRTTVQELIKAQEKESIDEQFIGRLHQIIEAHLQVELPDMVQISALMHMSRTQLHRRIKNLTGLSTTNYIREYKLKLALKQLEKGTGTVAEIAEQFGFGSLPYFSRSFKKSFGINPSDVVRQKIK